MIGTGSMCDPYIPLEKELCLTRRCLEVIEKYNFGAAVLTKSDLVLRDLDILERINKKTKAVVQMTLTTADDNLCRLIEPGVCPTSRRFEVLCECHKRGIPTVVWFSPLLPFINDTKDNIDGIFDYCIRAGVKAILCFGIGLTLRGGNREHFYSALDKIASSGKNASLKNGGDSLSSNYSMFTGLKERYIKSFGNSYMVASPHERELMAYLTQLCRKNNIMIGVESVFNWMKEFPEDSMQPSLF